MVRVFLSTITLAALLLSGLAVPGFVPLSTIDPGIGSSATAQPQHGAASLILPAAPTDSAAVVFQDRFRDGKPELSWQSFPGFNRDNLRGMIDPATPGEEAGVGILRNGNAGGFAALSYVDRVVPADFAVDTWVYTTVTGEQKGSLNGVAFLVDPAGQRFYRVASLFAAEPTLSLAYVGRDTDNYPVFLRTWRSDEIPGGAPAASGWHRLRIEVHGGRAEVYWDGAKLPGGPFAVDRVAAGFVGVYATYTGGLGAAETRVDDFTVQAFTTPAHTALIFALEPAFAAAFAFALGSEQLGTLALIGGVLMLAGMVVAELRR